MKRAWQALVDYQALQGAVASRANAQRRVHAEAYAVALCCPSREGPQARKTLVEKPGCVSSVGSLIGRFSIRSSP